jgi:uncharacterized protein (DUF1501 family)
MLIKRREFLKTASMATTALWIPRFLQARQPIGYKGRILVVLQLSGGNDGLNTVIPTRNDVYYRERPRLAISREEALAMGSEAGLHPALTGFKSLYDSGDLAVLNSVGYPNPDRSHFRSMDIWHSGSSAEEYWNTGWLGRYLGAQCIGCSKPSQALEIDDTLGLVLKGKDVKGLSFQDPKRLYDTAHSPYFDDLAAAYRGPDSPAGRPDDSESSLGYLYKTMAETLSSADYIYEKSKARPTQAVYPDTKLGKHFKTVASLILADSETSVYYLSHGSFDTHINQAGQQERLFKEMNDALDAFAKDMKANGRWEDVLCMTFSEFGRRVKQNASGGTDHGTANQMFFAGGRLREQGLLNELPNLTDLDKGDLKYQVDFRQAYSTVLKNWLRTDPVPIMGGRFEPLGFV